MSELMDVLPLADIGSAGLNVIFFLLFFTGRVLAKSVLDNERENTKTWQSVALTEQQTNARNSQALTELLALAHTTNHALTEIQAAGQQVRARPKEAEDS